MAFFSRFTERAQRALLAAQKEAAQLGRAYVGTEHLLLGILNDPGAAAPVLSGITLNQAREELIQLVGKGAEPVSYTHLDVYKRQPLASRIRCRSARRRLSIPPASMEPPS